MFFNNQSCTGGSKGTHVVNNNVAQSSAVSKMIPGQTIGSSSGTVHFQQMNQFSSMHPYKDEAAA